MTESVRTPRVLGLDLSLTCTGVAHSAGTTTITVRSKGEPRLIAIRDHVLQWITADKAELVVLEGYSRASLNRREEAGELGGIVRVALYERGVPYVVVAPTKRAKYATGRGNADKFTVLAEAIRRLGYVGSSNDEADALWLRAMGLDALGHAFVQLPQTHTAVLAGVDWPKVGEAA